MCMSIMLRFYKVSYKTKVVKYENYCSNYVLITNVFLLFIDSFFNNRYLITLRVWARTTGKYMHVTVIVFSKLYTCNGRNKFFYVGCVTFLYIK